MAIRQLLRIEKPHVLIACMPKSASTFLADVISALPGMRMRSLAREMGQREQVLDLVKLAQYDLQAYVTQLHLRYSNDVAQLRQIFHLSPVVLTRNIFDAIASARDHIRNESAVSSIATLVPEHALLPDSELEQLLADLLAPWYVAFFVSWYEVECLRVTYEEVRTSPEEVTARICRYAGIKTSAPDIETAVATARSKGRRFNQGIPGRGNAISAAAHTRIAAFARHYPAIDFAALGITREVAALQR